MTDLQVRYFLTAARCLNFTEAAKQLYITQPALSQQISALEHELNMQLFVRMKKRLYLTPAAVVLARELPQYEKHLAEILDRAKVANLGVSQALRLGLMEGQTHPDSWLGRFFTFREQYPNVEISTFCASFGALTEALLNDRVDVAYLPDLQILGNPAIHFVESGEDRGVAMISSRHPLAQAHITSFRQLRAETFLMLRESESSSIHEFILNDCKKSGFTPRIRYVASLNENIMCTELGMGVGITNHDSYGCFNPNITVLHDLKIANRKFVLAWKKANMNSAIPLFVHHMCPGASRQSG